MTFNTGVVATALAFALATVACAKAGTQASLLPECNPCEFGDTQNCNSHLFISMMGSEGMDPLCGPCIAHWIADPALDVCARAVVLHGNTSTRELMPVPSSEYRELLPTEQRSINAAACSMMTANSIIDGTLNTDMVSSIWNDALVQVLGQAVERVQSLGSPEPGHIIQLIRTFVYADTVDAPNVQGTGYRWTPEQRRATIQEAASVEDWEALNDAARRLKDLGNLPKEGALALHAEQFRSLLRESVLQVATSVEEQSRAIDRLSAAVQDEILRTVDTASVAGITKGQFAINFQTGSLPSEQLRANISATQLAWGHADRLMGQFDPLFEEYRVHKSDAADSVTESMRRFVWSTPIMRASRVGSPSDGSIDVSATGNIAAAGPGASETVESVLEAANAQFTVASQSEFAWVRRDDLTDESADASSGGLPAAEQLGRALDRFFTAVGQHIGSRIRDELRGCVGGIWTAGDADDTDRLQSAPFECIKATEDMKSEILQDAIAMGMSTTHEENVIQLAARVAQPQLWPKLSSAFDAAHAAIIHRFTEPMEDLVANDIPRVCTPLLQGQGNASSPTVQPALEWHGDEATLEECMRALQDRVSEALVLGMERLGGIQLASPDPGCIFSPGFTRLTDLLKWRAQRVMDMVRTAKAQQKSGRYGFTAEAYTHAEAVVTLVPVWQAAFDAIYALVAAEPTDWVTVSLALVLGLATLLVLIVRKGE